MSAARPPVLLMVAPNGARRTRRQHKALPITPAELAASARASRDAGAAMLHLHVRDAKERHSLDPGLYREAIAAVRETVGSTLMIQTTTEAVGQYSPAEQMRSVKAVRPEAVSLAVRELVPDAAHEGAAREFLHWLDEAEIQAQYILYDDADTERLFALRERGVMPNGPVFLLCVLGRYSRRQQSAPTDLDPFIAVMDRYKRAEDRWMVCAFGKRELDCAMAAAHAGGHARIGFENNLHMADGTKAADNAALIAQAANALREAGFALGDASDARALLRK